MSSKSYAGVQQQDKICTHNQGTKTAEVNRSKNKKIKR